MNSTTGGAVVRSYLLQHKGPFARALFWRGWYVIIPMQVPIITGAIVDGLTGRRASMYGFVWQPSTASEVLSWAAVALLAVALLYALSSYARMMSTARLSRSFVTDLRHRIVEHTARLSLAQHRKLGAGELLERTIADTRSMRQFIDRVYLQTIANALRLAYPIVMLFVLDAMLALVCLAVLPPQWIISRFLQRRLHAAAACRRGKQADLTTIVKENLDGAETLKSLNADGESTAAIQACAIDVETDELRANKFTALLNANVWFMTSVGVATVWWLGSMRVAAGTMTLGDLVVFTGFVHFAYMPFRMFSQIVATYRQGLVSLERIVDLLSIEPDISESKDAQPLVIRNGRVELSGIEFSYDAEPILSQINVTFLPRRITAIVGRSGSGKSSLLRLILRLYDTDAGDLCIDGQSLADVTLSSLRSQVSLVPQQPATFTGSLLDNLRMARQEASMAEVEQACAAAGALDFIRQLDDGFETRIGGGLTRLSGGQIQRIAIARALLGRPRILLLDEPTSALDPENEAALVATLRRLRNTMTIIIVAHRPQTIQIADDIVVLEAGRVVAQGSRNAVHARSAMFRNMFVSNEHSYADAA